MQDCRPSHAHALRALLINIIRHGAPGGQRVLHQLVHLGLALALRGVLHEPAAQPRHDRALAAAEAGQVVIPRQHHLHEEDDALPVLARGKKGAGAQLPVHGEHGGARAAHDGNKLSGELEGRGLKPNVPAG